MSLENLPMQPEPPVESWDAIPEQRGPSIPALPRGDYEFQLPHNLTADKWKVDKEKDKEGKETAVEHYRVAFDADLPLVVTATNISGVEENAIFRGSISTRPRPRYVGKRGDPPKLVSDAVYLYKDALKGPTVGIKANDEKAVRDAICKHGAGKKFVARIVWECYCNKNKVRYVLDAQGMSVEDPEGKLGCGKNYRDGKTIDQATGQISERFACECGAALRVFPELAQFRPPASEQAQQ